MLRTTDALGNTTRFSYNDLGQPTSITDANGNTTRNVYDDRGNLTRTFVRDSNRTVLSETTFSYDSSGNLEGTFDANDKSQASFAYNGSGDLTSTTDTNGVRRTFTVNEYGEVEGTSSNWVDPWSTGGDLGIDDGINLDPQTVSTSTVFDDQGRVVKSTDSNGNVSITQYDDLGRVERTIRRTRTGGSIESPSSMAKMMSLSAFMMSVAT